jgi:MFS family permease
MVGTVFGAIISGQLMGRIVHYKRVPVLGLFFATLGAMSLALWADAVPLALLAIILAMIGVGLGTVLPTTTVAIQNSVETHQLGTATGTVNFFRQLASAVTVAIFGALLNASDINEAALHSVASIPAGDFTPIFTATAVGFVIAFVFILWMKENPLRSDARHAAEAVFAD